MSTFQLVGISGSLSRHSKTETALRGALAHLSDEPDVQTEAILLSELTLPFCDGRKTDAYTGDARTVIDKIVAADAIIFGSPIFRGSYTGAFKNLLDILPNDSLEGKATGIIATGGSNHHYLSIEHQFKPVLGFFNAYVVPGGVYLNNSHFRDGQLADEDALDRLGKLVSEVYRLGTVLRENYQGPGQPTIHRKSLQES